MVDDLKERYWAYCRANNVDELATENIMNSPEIAAFGALYSNSVVIPYVFGILGPRVSGTEAKQFIQGLVRIPPDMDLEEEGKKRHIFRRMWDWGKSLIYSPTGLLPNMSVPADALCNDQRDPYYPTGADLVDLL